MDYEDLVLEPLQSHLLPSVAVKPLNDVALPVQPQMRPHLLELVREPGADSRDQLARVRRLHGNLDVADVCVAMVDTPTAHQGRLRPPT